MLNFNDGAHASKFCYEDSEVFEPELLITKLN